MSYYQIKNKRGSTVYLGIDAVGISVFEIHDKRVSFIDICLVHIIPYTELNIFKIFIYKTTRTKPKVGFPWSEIQSISFSGKKFTIRSIDNDPNSTVLSVVKLFLPFE